MLPIRIARAEISSAAMSVPFGTDPRWVGCTPNGVKVNREVSWTMDGLLLSFVSGARSVNFRRAEPVNPRTVNVPSKLFAASSCSCVACARISSTEATKTISPAVGSTPLLSAKPGSPEKWGP